MKIGKKLAWLSIPWLFVACAPQIYVVDRHTIMEEESAGEWPDFEKEILDKAKTASPVPFQKTPDGAKKKRLYNTLNGEMVK